MTGARLLGLAAMFAALLPLAACDGSPPPPQAAPRPAAPLQAPVPPAAAAARAPSSASEAPPGLTLAGVVSFGATDARSQALLAVARAPAQVFHPGDEVTAGWMLRSVADDHVVIARGAARQRIDMAAPARAAAPAAQASSARLAAAAEKPLPGFVESAPPRMSANDGQASARNRAFLQGVQERRATLQQQP